MSPEKAEPVARKGLLLWAAGIIAVGLYLFDTFLNGPDIIASCLVLLAVGGLASVALIAVFAKNRQLALPLFIIAVVLLFSTLKTNQWNNEVAKNRAALIAEACKKYRAKHKALPEKLEDLVPEYLASIPPPKVQMRDVEFKYQSETGTLWWVVFRPFGKMAMDIDSGKTRQLPD